MLVLDVLSRKRLHAPLKENVFKGPFKKIVSMFAIAMCKIEKSEKGKKKNTTASSGNSPFCEL